MHLPSPFSQLRNRYARETQPQQPQPAATTASNETIASGTSATSGVSSTSSKSRSSGSTMSLDDDWANIPSVDYVSSQPDSARPSIDDSSQTDAKTKLLTTKSDLENTLVTEEQVLQPKPAPSGNDVWTSDQKNVYENQLENLQEQLVDIMIENQTLAQKLQRYENSDIIPLLKKLEEERERNENLSQKCRVLEKHVRDKGPSRQASAEEASAEEVGVDAVDLVYTSSGRDLLSGPVSKPSRLERLQNFVVDTVYTIMADLTEEDEEDNEPDENPQGDELTVKRLKENLKRFKSACNPGLKFFKAVHALLSWKSSSNTFFAFLIYMYVVWRGWSTTVIFGLMIWYLTTTYFISMGWSVNLSLLPYHLIEENVDEGPPLSMSDKFQLVLHVCRKVQNLLGQVADVLERINNFLYWTNPELTKHLYRQLVLVFIASFFISGSTLFTCLGLFLGVKIFLINPVLRKYPRLKAKFSFERKIFTEVPTHAELEQRRAMEEAEQFLAPDIDGITIQLAESRSHDHEPISKRWKAYSQSLKLPETEQPLQGWKDGKRCTMINKTTMTKAFKNGRLYLTNGFLCFEKSRLVKEGNLVIPLKDVTSIEKAKPFGFLPGSGMSIEIQLSTSAKPVVFGAILNRDMVHGEVVKVWQAAILQRPCLGDQGRAGRGSEENTEASGSTGDEGGITGEASSSRIKEGGMAGETSGLRVMEKTAPNGDNISQEEEAEEQ